jgi:hypothetical protein
VYLEVGKHRTFACSLDWPGWCRAGKDEQSALDTLGDYAPRYAIVAVEAGIKFPKKAGDAFDIVERLPGDASTDFGVIGKPVATDSQPLTAAVAARQLALLEASWRVLDRVVAGAPASLRKGPRGGGRDRDKIVEHVVSAEASYFRKLGGKTRADVVAILGAARAGTPLVEKGWPPRYAYRRIVWHVLDHAWEIQDKSE